MAAPDDLPISGITCPCQQQLPEAIDMVAQLQEIRAKCQVLKEYVLPAEHWSAYLGIAGQPLDEAHHVSIPLLAIKHGILNDFTYPLHHFFAHHQFRTRTLNSQYRKDFAETWIFQHDYRSRFQASRIFLGRWFELCFARWLEENGWAVIALEAYGDPYDIEAVAPDQTKAAIEVKYLAEDEAAFELGVTACRKGATAGSLAVYSPLDYLIFRAYEAAKKVSCYPGRKIIALLLYDYALHFQIALEEEWIDWKTPRFFRGDSDIIPFLTKQMNHNPRLDHELSGTFQGIDEIWIFAAGAFAIKRMHVIPLR